MVRLILVALERQDTVEQLALQIRKLDPKSVIVVTGEIPLNAAETIIASVSEFSPGVDDPYA